VESHWHIDLALLVWSLSCATVAPNLDAILVENDGQIRVAIADIRSETFDGELLPVTGVFGCIAACGYARQGATGDRSEGIGIRLFGTSAGIRTCVNTMSSNFI